MTNFLIPNLYISLMLSLCDVQIDGSTPNACWKEIYCRIKEKQCNGATELERSACQKSGSYMFGFSNPQIRQLIQVETKYLKDIYFYISLNFVEDCIGAWARQLFILGLLFIAIPINRSLFFICVGQYIGPTILLKFICAKLEDQDGAKISYRPINVLNMNPLIKTYKPYLADSNGT